MTTHSETDRELDAALAEKLFGIEVCHRPQCWARERSEHHEHTPDLNTYLDLRAWSSTGDGLLQVLEAMRERGWESDMEGYETGDGHMWHAAFDNENFARVITNADTLPRAVAEAALAALEG